MLCLGTPGRSKPAQNDAEKCAGFYTHWISIAPLPQRSILGLTGPTGLEGALTFCEHSNAKKLNDPKISSFTNSVFLFLTWAE